MARPQSGVASLGHSSQMQTHHLQLSSTRTRLSLIPKVFLPPSLHVFPHKQSPLSPLSPLHSSSLPPIQVWSWARISPSVTSATTYPLTSPPLPGLLLSLRFFSLVLLTPMPLLCFHSSSPGSLPIPSFWPLCPLSCLPPPSLSSFRARCPLPDNLTVHPCSPLIRCGRCSPCRAQSVAGTCRASSTAGHVAQGHPTALGHPFLSGGCTVPRAGTSRWLLWVSQSQQTPCRGTLGKGGEKRRQLMGNGRPASALPCSVGQRSLEKGSSTHP